METPTRQEPEPQDSKSAIGKFIKQCIEISAYLKELETQSHLIHLNYEGTNFLAVHAFLKDQYKAHLKQFDKMSEYIRSMDYLMPMCGKGLRSAASKFDHVDSYQGGTQLYVYSKNLETLGMKCKKLEPVATKIGAIDIANFLADPTGDAFKAAWMVKASLR